MDAFSVVSLVEKWVEMMADNVVDQKASKWEVSRVFWKADWFVDLKLMRGK
jgi:hypothetical protein